MKKWIWICLLVAVIAVVRFWRADNVAPQPQDRWSPVADDLLVNEKNEKTNGADVNSGTSTTKTDDDQHGQKLISLQRDPNFPYRLRNTGLMPTEMFRQENSILLRNAFIDTGRSLEDLNIPEHLKANSDPMAYILKSVGRIDDDFRELLKKAKIEVVSYIPHNSYLVKANEEQVNWVKASSKVLAVVPFEPYYKLNADLLPMAVEQQGLPGNTMLRVALFPDTLDAAKARLKEIGAQVMGESKYPFGHVVNVASGEAKLVDLVQLPEVQLVEPYAPVRLLNDLSRPRLGVSTAVSDPNNLHGLTGLGVVVGVNGSGVDPGHPDLAGRVIQDDTTPLEDGTGHETHVAGVIASSGQSTPGAFTNGSSAGSTYSGKAPDATLYPLSILPATAVVTNIGPDPITGNTGAILDFEVTFGSRYPVPSGIYIPPTPQSYPSVTISDSTPLTTNGLGEQLTPGRGAEFLPVLSNGIVIGIVPYTNTTTTITISGPNQTTTVGYGTNYSISNTTVSIVSPWSDFDIIEQQASRTNVYIVNNSWSNGRQGYDILSAMYDSAVRDSLPGIQGDQERNYVFSAGNSGFGTTDGQGGRSDSIESPSTAKNVISVGAIENLRNIPAQTNFQTALAESDSPDQVTSFSSRGNTGIGLEGDHGRYKPDLVAPGGWVLSLAASTFDVTNRTPIDLTLGNNNLRYDSGTSMAAPAVSGLLALMQEFFTTNYSRTNSPALNKALLINGARPASSQYDFAPRGTINYQGWGVPQLSNTIPGDLVFLTNNAATVSGSVVAVDQNSFGTSTNGTNRIQTGQTHNYEISVSGTAEDFPLRITLAWTDPPGNPVSSMQLVNDLDLVVSNKNTGQVYLGNLIPTGSDFNEVSESYASNGLASVERDFVNNVENVFISGPFTNSGSGVNLSVQVHGARVNVNAVESETNAVVQDYVLVVSTEVGSQISLKHDNGINTLTNRPLKFLLNGIPLDEEIVGANHPFETNNHGGFNAYGTTNQWNFYVFTNTSVSPTTNVNTSVIGTTTNSSTNVVSPLTNVGPNVAFITFRPPNAGRPRNTEADIDVYVTRSTDAPSQGAPALTNLAPGILWDPKTLRSTNRGGLEVISFDDASIGEVFYVGVKSEDQQSGRYGFLAVSLAEEFVQTNADGTIGIPFFPAPVEIPDGSPASPGGIQLFGISTISTNIISPFITNTIAHGNFGDLSISLTHNDKTVHLWNHYNNFPGGIYSTQTRYFDANAFGISSTNRVADGPGEMADFFDDDAIGLWILSVTDDSLNHTGAVIEAGLRIGDTQNRNRTNDGNRTFVSFTLDPGASFVDSLIVPFTATQMLVSVQGAPNSDPGVDLFVAYNQIPPAPFFTNVYFTNINGSNFSTTNFVTNFNILSLLGRHTATGEITVDFSTTPPLTPGPWFSRVVNNTSATQNLTLIYELGLNLATESFVSYESLINSEIEDLAVSEYSTISVPGDRTLVDVEVAVGIEHPRPSDLVGHIIAPSGKRVLLFENRGDLSRTNLFANFTEDTNMNTAMFTDVSVGTLHHFSNLVEIKWVTNQFTNGITPPRLLTHNTVGSSHHIRPESISIPGNSVYVSGTLRTNALGTHTNWGMILNYPLPFTNNSMPTNWMTIWPSNMVASARSQTTNQSDIVVFNDLIATTQGVFVVASTNKDYFPVTPGAVGYTNEFRIDVDTGSTNGRFIFDLNTYTLRDHFHVYYEGNVQTNSTNWPGVGNNPGLTYSNDFSGSETFVRLVVNQGGNTNPGTAWELTGIRFTNLSANPIPPRNQSIVLGYEPNGPLTNDAPLNLATNGAIMITRALTNNPYGVSGVDRLFGIASHEETGGNQFVFDENGALVRSGATGTNFLYVVGSAQFDLARTEEKFILSKLDYNGLPVWTATEQVGAAATVTVDTNGSITSIDVVCAGTNYSSAPDVTIVDLHSQGSNATATASINLLTGHVTGISTNNPGSGYQRPAIYVEKPALSGVNASAGLDVALYNGTTVYAVGYSNTTAAGTVSRPSMWAYDTQGCLLWTRNETSFNGRYNAVQVSRTNLFAAGYHITGSGESSSMLQRLDHNGNVIVSTNYTHIGAVMGDPPEDFFDDFLVMLNPDRVYAVGTRTNANSTTDAILMEIDPETLEQISLTIIDKSGGNERGKGVATDGKDLYVLVESEVGGVTTTDIYHYRVRNYYLAEEDLGILRGEGASGTWTLRVWDNRIGGTNGVTNATPPRVRYWGLNLTMAAPGVPTFALPSDIRTAGTLLSTGPQYFRFYILPGTMTASINVTSPGNISAAVNQGTLPSFGEQEQVLFSNGSGGSYTLTNRAGGFLRPGAYYLAIQNGLESIGNSYSVEVKLGESGTAPEVIPILENGVSQNGIVTAGPGFSVYAFEVPAGASGARFELTSASSDANLFLRKDDGSGSVPSPSNFDYRSIQADSGDETIFLVPDANASKALTPGTWYLGVQNVSPNPVNFSVEATSLTGVPYNIVAVSSGQAMSGRTVVGNAPEQMYKIGVTEPKRAVVFEVSGLSGPGDLLVRKGSEPLTTTFDVSSHSTSSGGRRVALVKTNSVDQSLIGDWYYGVMNKGDTNISYTAVATVQSGALLVGDGPLRMKSLPTPSELAGGDSFGFGMDVVPGETYQVQYSATPTGPWFILTNITAPPHAQIEFVHPNALTTNSRLMYRIQQVQ